MQNSIVIDLGYGNSRLGQVVDWLSGTFEYDVVARYNGGPQSGNVVSLKKDSKEISHDFQIYGSGSLREINTVLLPNVVFDPILLWKEYLELKSKIKVNQLRMIIDYHCPVITPYDVYLNQHSSKNLSDGTSGKGVFTTKQREKNHHHIHAIDLQYPDVLAHKLLALKKAYQFPVKLADGTEYDVDLTEFLHCATEIANKSNFIIRSIVSNDDVDSNVIFESSAGLMLDENIGIFPHCTPSKLDVPEQYKINNIYLVAKAYHTRHGNGPLTTETTPVSLNKNIDQENAYQGALRSGILDLDVLLYALQSSNVQEYLYKNKETKLFIVFTHLDDIKDEWSYKYKGFISKFKDEESFVRDVLREIINTSYTYDCRLKGCYISKGKFGEDITEFDSKKNIKLKDQAIPRITTRQQAPPVPVLHEASQDMAGSPGMAITAADLANHAIRIDNDAAGPRPIDGRHRRDIRDSIINERMATEPGSLREVADAYGRAVIVNGTSEENARITRDGVSPQNGQWYDDILDQGPEFDGAGNENPAGLSERLNRELTTAGEELVRAFEQIDAETSGMERGSWVPVQEGGPVANESDDEWFNTASAASDRGPAGSY